MDDETIIGSALTMDWESIKDSLGFGPPCMNGGKRGGGVCRCMKHFIGRLCESIICFNNGRSINNNTECQCPDQHIRGRFCELLDCENGGTDTKQGYCECPYGWYTGSYCEIYSTPWNIVLGVAIAVLVILTLVCFIWRLDLCDRCCQKAGQDPDEELYEQRSSQLDRRYSWRWRDRSRTTDAGPDQEGNATEEENTREPANPMSIRHPPAVPPEEPVLQHLTDETYKPPESPPPPYEEVAHGMNYGRPAGVHAPAGVYSRNNDSSL